MIRKTLSLAAFLFALFVSMDCHAQFWHEEEFDLYGDEEFLDDTSDDGFDGSVPFTDDSDEPFLDTFPNTEHCSECRDPNLYPMDYIAFYYNGNMFLGQGPFRENNYYLLKITYGDGTNFVLVWTSIVLDTNGSMLFPTQTITFSLRLPNGQVIQLTTLVNQPNLPIGDQNDPIVDTSDEEEDDFSEDEEENYDGDDDSDWGDDDWGDDWGDESDDDDGDSCGSCEFFFDGDEDGELNDDEPYGPTEEEEL
ncbi:MAG: hypothetical protein QNJ14_15430 [Woeseiaceae bacterium]|nr:hypothetical protein [Woeseiaceae bacterium]